MFLHFLFLRFPPCFLFWVNWKKQLSFRWNLLNFTFLALVEKMTYNQKSNILRNPELRGLKENHSIFQPGVFPINVVIVTIRHANFALTTFVVEIWGLYQGKLCESLTAFEIKMIFT